MADVLIVIGLLTLIWFAFWGYGWLCSRAKLMGQDSVKAIQDNPQISELPKLQIPDIVWATYGGALGFTHSIIDGPHAPILNNKSVAARKKAKKSPAKKVKAKAKAKPAKKAKAKQSKAKKGKR